VIGQHDERIGPSARDAAELLVALPEGCERIAALES
jgi:hypothetical protein